MNAAPSADPVPWITARMKKAAAFTTKPVEVGYGPHSWQVDPITGNREYRQATRTEVRLSDEAASSILDILAQTVSALHDDAKPYVVVMSAQNATAATLLERKIVEVGSKPLSDDDLTDGQKAAVMAGLVLHEVGHIRFARQYAAAVTRRFSPAPVTQAVNIVSNIAADLHDETAACAMFPGLAPAVAVTLWWVGNKGQSRGTSIDGLLRESAMGRINAMIAATRYPWTAEWDSQDALDWRDWWVDWAERATQAGQPKMHAEIVWEGIQKIRDFTPTQPVDGPGPTCGPVGPGGEQPPGGSDEPPTGEKPGKGEGPGGGEPTDEPPTGEGPGGQGGEPTDDEPKGEGRGTNADDGKGEEPKGSQPGTSTGSDKGSLGGGDEPKPYDASENGKPSTATCPKDAAKDAVMDAVLQAGVEKVNKGKREGMRRRTYAHGANSAHETRTVVAVPRKGKVWVTDGAGS